MCHLKSVLSAPAPGWMGWTTQLRWGLWRGGQQLQMSHAQIKQLSKRRFMFSTLRKVEFSKNLSLRMKCNISPNLVVLFKTPFMLEISVSVGELINIKSVKKKNQMSSPWCVVKMWRSECAMAKERVDAPDQKRFDGDAEEECFWHERGQRVIMMSLGAYSKTDWRRLLCYTTPKGHHYQLEVSRDLSTGQTQEVISHTHTDNLCTFTCMDTHACLSPFLTHSHAQTSGTTACHANTNWQSVWPLTADGGLLFWNLTNSLICKWTPLRTNALH